MGVERNFQHTKPRYVIRIELLEEREGQPGGDFVNRTNPRYVSEARFDYSEYGKLRDLTKLHFGEKPVFLTFDEVEIVRERIRHSFAYSSGFLVLAYDPVEQTPKEGYLDIYKDGLKILDTKRETGNG